MKGLIADELEEEFGFSIITATDIVISYLPNKVANTVTTVAEIQELLKVAIIQKITENIPTYDLSVFLRFGGLSPVTTLSITAVSSITIRIICFTYTRNYEKET